MPGCCAVGCTNSDKKGFKMNVFPRDLQRRKEWTVKVRRENWTPTNTSYLCECHFDEEQWELHRADGKRKLKWKATPTIFSYKKITPKRKPPKPRLPPVNEDESSSTSGELDSLTKELMAGSSVESSKIQTLERKLGMYEKLFKKSENSRKILKHKIRLEHMKNKTLINEKLNNKYLNILKKCFNEDQIKSLCRKSNKYLKWSYKTIKDVLQIRFACGGNGYEELRQKRIPLPTLRTLRRKLENINFESGILDEVFSFLKMKVKQLKEHEKHCALILDEMSITPSKVYDVSSKTYYGSVTLPNHSGLATHGLVFMLAGISSRWKQTIAYFFTSNSVKGGTFKPIIIDIIRKATEIDLQVVSCTSDMGAANQALWRSFGICSTRNTLSSCSENPIDPQQKIYFMADVPHLLKSVKSSLLNNKYFILPDFVKEINNLPTNIVDVGHLKFLEDYQEHFLKLAPALNAADLSPSHFEKMRVSGATNLFNHETASALRFLAEESKQPSFITTAWFIDVTRKLFDLMTARHPKLALSNLMPHEYQAAISFLQDHMNLFLNLKCGDRQTWKPIQSGVRLSTNTILNLQHYFLEEQKFAFLLTGRFLQDCVENLFSQIRSVQVIPNALQFKRALKLISVSQYLKNVSTSNYFQDDSEFLSDFLDIHEMKQILCDEKLNLNNITFETNIDLNISERNSLYNIAIYILSRIKNNNKRCDACLNSLGNKKCNKEMYSKLVNLKCYKLNTLFYANAETFELFMKMEALFRANYDCLCSSNTNLESTFYQIFFKRLDFSHIKKCHKLNEVVIKKFVRFSICGKKHVKHCNKSSMGSKSQHAHTT